MAKERVVKERVTLVSPKGSRVTAGVDLAARLQAKGYRVVGEAVVPEATEPEVPMTEAELAKAAEAEAAGDPEATPPADGSTPDRPNRGASLASWAAYADARGVAYPEGAGRDEVRDLVEAAHPAE